VNAVVLVGGEGTRMRPLTETIPKPLLPMVDRPFLDHVLDRLAQHGVTRVILSSPYLEEVFHPFLQSRAGRSPSVEWITEAQPLGTAGAIANALDRLDDTFLVLNGDILTDLDLGAMLDFHRTRGALATISLAEVEDARPFGLVDVDPNGRVGAFREKPSDPVKGRVNTGTYVLEPAAVRGVSSTRAVSIETEVFPALISSKVPVYGFLTDSYWMDLGTPDKYMRATFDVLEGRVQGMTYDAPFLGDDVEVAASAQVGPRVVLGRGSVLGPDAVIADSVLFAGTRVEARARVVGSILGHAVHVGADAMVARSVLAEGAVVPPGGNANDAKVPPFTVLER
jgi:mannose-1-phosphate guanylyltransferase